VETKESIKSVKHQKVPPSVLGVIKRERDFAKVRSYTITMKG